MAQKIIFLDFDGVLLTDRSTERYGYGVLDPDACALVNKLCEQSGARLVVCSSWLGPDSSEVWQMMEQAGLAPYLHEDWRIGKEGVDVQAGDKFPLIIDWVKEHGVNPKDIAILDDRLAQTPRITGMWKSRVVSPCSDKGLSFRDCVQAKALLGVPLDRISEKLLLNRTKTEKAR